MDIYKRLLAYVKPHRWRLFVAVLSMFAYSIANSLVSATLYIIVNGLYNKDEVRLDNLPHIPFLSSISFPVFWIPFVMIGVFFLRGFFDYLSNYQMSNIGIRAIRQVRDDLYRHLVYLSHDFYSRGRTGDFLSRIMNDVGQIQGAITDVIVDLVKQPLVILFNIPWVFIWGGKYALFAILIFPLVAVPITILGKRLRKLTKSMQERTGDITSFIGETLSGFHIVKAFCREEKEISRFEEINRSVFEYFRKTIKVTIIQRPLIEVMGAIGAGIAVGFGIKYLPPDRFVAFVGSLFIFYEPLKKISKVNSTIQQSIAAGQRIFEVLDARPSIRNKPGALVFKEPVHEVAYENVSFEYEKGTPILQGIDIRAKQNEVIAIVGASGSGKTTLVSLLLRFYDPTEGIIRINGKDIRELSLESLRGMIGIVSQETVLFNCSVKDNIAYGRPEAAIEDVRKAAMIAYADHFIEALPQGYDTQLGERGLKLSGGERQRLAIARALIKDPPILILDEATSHLDTQSEKEVQKALENLMKNRTVFVIAHRLSTVQKASRILVMEEGKIVQQGTNEFLLRLGGVYKKLYDLQFNL
ncbi:MAG TPA: ABC transporter ATP-binding protein [Candidatus Omnitrophota bacterium]|jgi:subfamily B ATP-binding cassette protein MsbA|nr:MAG: Lipid A export ATP-binding/permease protein MsbA [Candidatus Omnitrophica bacterium ADurb.Bin314]HOE68561.1 ABC transporter ATP-binding protein [Candidatus Omnitrophota bacterium]HPW64940.1 ABC transporter ATP-binding protein [Candidatus Omnitrophota bacterium]HQB93587.1 ABC transporter ATP-binding protein [Candidatus Omnitrophota bacterium]